MAADLPNALKSFMDRTLPPGFKFHQGLDGLLFGLSIVFVARIHMAFSTIVDWRIVPRWTYQPFVTLGKSIVEGIQSTMRSFSAPSSVSIGGTELGASGGTGSSAAGSVDPAIISMVTKAVGFPVAITGALTASLIEQILIIIGFWIAFLVPFWYWGLRPLLFWWRSTDFLSTPRPD